MNLYKAYERVPNQVFHNWLIRKKENYKEGANIIHALKRYQSLKSEGKWQNTSTEDKRIIALTAQFQQMHHMLQGINMRLKSNL